MRSRSLLIRAATFVPLLIGCAVLSAAGGGIIRDIGAGAGVPSPGIPRVVVTNVEPREGQIAVTLEQLSDFPPEFETSLLIPLAGIAAVSLTVSGTFLVVSIRLKRLPA